MPRLLLHADGPLGTVPLLPITIVGRGARCHARLPHPSVPLHWLEVRWSGVGWTWRELGQRDLTRGAGRLLSDGWRLLGAEAGGGSARVRWGDGVWIELVGAGPPEPVLEDVIDGTMLDGAALDAWLEQDGGNCWPLSADRDPQRALRDGDVLREGERVFRVHLPGPIASTDRACMMIDHPAVELELDRQALAATFVIGSRSLRVEGESVRLLLAYAQARSAGDGWLTTEQAHTAWVALGGNPTSEVERVRWERGKLRTLLVRGGAGRVDALFATQRVAGRSAQRLTVEPERLHLRG